MAEVLVETGYEERLAVLRAVKMAHTRVKQVRRGAMDHDDQGQVPLPEEHSEVVEAVSGSGEVVRDVRLKGFAPESNHPSGGFFGARAVGANFRRLLAVHPTYIHPANSMAGVYMVNFNSYRKPLWNPDFDFGHLQAAHKRYGIEPGIGGLQHFCPDLKIGLDLGWGGLLEKVRHYAVRHPAAADFYAGLESVVLGMQAWIERHAEAAVARAREEEDPVLRGNVRAIAAICARLAAEPPATFREACQWLVFFQAAAKMYNGSGEWGQLDELLRPYYERDSRAGTLTDEEATFHLACLLLSETAYIQLGGPDETGRDLTSAVSFLILEAIHKLKIPANIGVRVGPNVEPALLRRGVEILIEDGMGFPKFVGDETVIAGALRNGYPLEAARARVYAGCHWLAVPGREYGMMDLIKIELGTVFDLSLREMMADRSAVPCVAALWERFGRNLRRAVAVTAEGIDFHIRHMPDVFPELLLDLFCYGPVEKGRDASGGVLAFTNIGVDAASLATVADSFAAIEQRVEIEKRLTWEELLRHLDANWEGPAGEATRLCMASMARFGAGESRADGWAERISTTFSTFVKENTTPDGWPMTPGLFSWAKAIAFGKRLGATPNGRKAGAPLSHGPNPAPGFNAGKGGTPVQMAIAVAKVQPGFGNTAPLQVDIDPGAGGSEEDVEKIEALIKAHFELGGTLININVLDKQRVLDAYRNPAAYPDLIVRVTGFSAYFASLSDDLRKYVVDRLLDGR
ncbi:MAG: formate acetyltransferase [Kiritimatiellae bacterium]|nr:formate acetyltransferase [Kiritimatiellia bacterium]